METVERIKGEHSDIEFNFYSDNTLIDHTLYDWSFCIKKFPSETKTDYLIEPTDITPESSKILISMDAEYWDGLPLGITYIEIDQIDKITSKVISKYQCKLKLNPRVNCGI